MPDPTARALALYTAQLQRTGPRGFAQLAHGPFATRRAEAEATMWVNAAADTLRTATAATAQAVLRELLVGNLLNAYRLLATHPVNERPYVKAPQAQPARPERLYSTPVPAGPANNEALLVVSVANWCRLTKPLLTVAGLSWGQQVQLVVPTKRGGTWYLDTRPKPGAGRRLPAEGKPLLFRVPPIPRWHFQLTRGQHGPAGAVGRGFVANTNTQVPLRYFRLGAEHPEHPGYFLLEPVAGKAGAGL